MAMLALGTIFVAAPYIVYGFQQSSNSMGYRIFLALFNSVAYGGTMYSNAELTKYANLFQLGGTQFFFNPVIYLVLIIRGYVITLLSFQKPWLLWGEHYLSSPLAGTVGAVFLIIGLGLSIKNAKQSRYLLILIWFFTVITVFSALNNFPPREDHMVPVIPAMAVLIGLGLNALSYPLSSAYTWLTEHRNIILAILLAAVGIGGLVDYYVISPQYFKQKPTDILSWAELDSHGESIVYIYQDPTQQDFVPYVKAEFLKTLPYETVPVGYILNGDKTISNTTKTLAFFPPELTQQITPLLQAQWGKQLVRRTFYDSDGKAVLVAEMNTPFVFERDRPFLNTLLDSLGHPPFLIFIFGLITLLALAVFIPAAWISHLPVRLKRVADWFNRPEQPEVAMTETEEEKLRWLNKLQPSVLRRALSNHPNGLSKYPSPILIKNPTGWQLKL